MRAAEHVVVYEDARFYSAFPSIVATPTGELLVAFRRAPERRLFSASGCTHTDPNSYLVLVRSHDGGASWTDDPEPIYAHPFGGSQDPCMVQIDDGSLVVTSYAWMALPEPDQAAVEGQNKREDRRVNTCGWAFCSLGGYIMRSGDNGRTWQGPALPPQLDDQAPGLGGMAHPVLNRGAMVQARDGHLYWIVATATVSGGSRTRLDLMTSVDRGVTWTHRTTVAEDDTVTFNETSLVETTAGDLVAFVRTAGFDDHTVVVRSHDLGKTWEPWEDTGIVGHPHHALRLPDGRVYLVYGYRHEPYGIRARLLDPDCRDFCADELVLRADGGTTDLGYPWSCQLHDGRILSVYYYNREDGTRHIAGTYIAVD